MSERDDLIRGLRQLADWYEAHPNVPLPPSPSLAHCVLSDDDAAGEYEVRQVANALGVAVEAGDGGANAGRTFAGLNFRVYYCNRQSMLQYEEMMAAGRAAVEAGAR